MDILIYCSPFYSYVENNSFCWTLNLSPTVFLFISSPLAAYSMHEPIIPRGARQGPSQLKRTCSIFAYEDIREVHKRRYLLQVGWLSVPSVLSCSFIQSMYCFKTDPSHENSLQDLHYPIEYFIDHSLNLGMWQTNWHHMLHNSV